MIFQNRMRDPKKLVPLATMCLVIAILLPMFFHPASQLGKNLSHGVSGALLGFSLVVNLWSARLMSRQRRCSRSLISPGDVHEPAGRSGN